MPNKTKSGAAVLERTGAADRLIGVRDVSELLDCSDRHVWKLSYSARLPTPVRVGRAVKWRLSDIERYIVAGCDMRMFAGDRKPVAVVR